MKLSTKTRYGTRILIELALHQGEGALQVAKIAEKQKIPVKYLEQLIRTLKKAGLVESVRGPKGGHLLAKDPSSISLGEIVRLFEGQTDLVECVSTPGICDMSSECLVRSAWERATAVLYENLDNINISDLTNSSDNGKGFASTICATPVED